MEEKSAIHPIRRESTRICTVTEQWLLQLATGQMGQRARVTLYVDGSIDQDGVVEGLERGARISTPGKRGETISRSPTEAPARPVAAADGPD